MFKNRDIVIFGANGWVGRALIDFLLNHAGKKVSEIFPVSSSVREIELVDGETVRCFRLEDMLTLQLKRVVLFHVAFKLKDQADDLTEYTKINLQIREDVIVLIDHLKPEKMVYFSSGAVYAKSGGYQTDFGKDPYGYLKYQDELVFCELARKAGRYLAIPRVFNLAGPYINRFRSYVISDLILQAEKTGKMVIRSDRPVIRSYIHIFDLQKILVRWLESPDSSLCIFDTGNSAGIEIGELARLTMRVLGIDAEIIRSKNVNEKNFKMVDRYVGDISRQDNLASKYNVRIQTHTECIQSVAEYLQAVGEVKSN